MSKEKTPIERLSISIPIYNHLKWSISRLRYFNEYHPTDIQRIELIFSINEMFKNRHEASKEQYAQAKVLEERNKNKREFLEALEREIKKCVNYYGYDDVEQNVYYETEVKPKFVKSI
jgi:hypothetical protein